MTVLSIVLFWLPVIGPLVAGYVGGRKAGSLPKALVAALLPAVVLGLLVGLLLVVFDLELLGALAGLGVFAWILVQDVPLLVAAAVGGLLSDSRP
jgi:hypothetical protein